MPTPPPDAEATPLPTGAAATVLRLLVRNHPGVLSHVSGLFARRAFNVDGILCVPVGDGTRSAVLLLVRADDRLEQLVLQLAKLEDVLDVALAPNALGAFAAVAEFLDPTGAGSA
jgi:acetolactate synthase-1/3 small subunit